METTFITIHDLTSEASILYASDSIVDILGHTPDEVVNKPCWDFFHPSDVEGAKQLHGRGVKLDKAAVLTYCYLLHRDGTWVNCECCFTCVYDVMVVCTSIYRPGLSSQKRATEAPIVRRLFASSPKDPRYHMLSHLSTKFQRPIQEDTREPRAALFLNRFTRTLTIMYATSGIEQIIGVSGEDMKGRSFYYCIAENCLEDAVKCLETAKGNDSIAYLRFWFRDPRLDDPPADSDTMSEEDTAMTDVTDDGEDDGGVRLEVVPPEPRNTSSASASGSASSGRDRTQSHSMDTDMDTSTGPSRTPSDPTDIHQNGESNHRPSLSESMGLSSTPTSPSVRGTNRRDAIELEAVVSCTSDGLVVILRRARPLIPGSFPELSQLQTNTHPSRAQPPPPRHRGIFAAPWGAEPIFIPEQPRPSAPGWYHGMHPLDMQPPSSYGANMYGGGPNPHDFMQSIREVAVFAWALVGINGNLVEHAVGRAEGDAQPPGGFPVWDTGYSPSRDSGNATQAGSPGPYSGGGEAARG